MTTPLTIATANPVIMYSPAIRQPNIPKSIARAISLTIGVAIKKEKVTPNGIPLSTKPMKSGTAEQEQKGVTTPNPAANTLPIPSRLPPSKARVCSGLKNERTRVTIKIIPVNSSKILGTSYRKKLTDSSSRVSGDRPIRL